MPSASWGGVRAIVRSDLTEDQAFRVGFVENVRRKDYAPMDRAHAIWRAIHGRGMSKAEVAHDLGLSVRQVERYIRLLDLPAVLRDAVAAGSITMAHAAALYDSRVRDLDKWLRRIEEEGLSARQLKIRLGKAGKAGSRRRKFLVEEEDGFRLFPVRFKAGMEASERARLAAALRRALDILEGQGE